MRNPLSSVCSLVSHDPYAAHICSNLHSRAMLLGIRASDAVIHSTWFFNKNFNFIQITHKKSTSATTFGQDRAIRTTDRSSSKVRTWNCSRSCVNFRFCCSAFACKVSLHRPATVRQSGTLDENCSVSFSMVVEFLIVRFSAREARRPFRA